MNEQEGLSWTDWAVSTDVEWNKILEVVIGSWVYECGIALGGCFLGVWVWHCVNFGLGKCCSQWQISDVQWELV